MLPGPLNSLYTKLFLRDRVIFIIASATVVVYGVMLFLLFLGFNDIYSADREYITLHYNSVFGTDFVARWFTIFLVPLCGFVIAGINTFVGYRIYNLNKHLTYACALTALVSNILLFCALQLLLRVNS